MPTYRHKPGEPFEAFMFGSLEKRPEWLEAAYTCGLVTEYGRGGRDGPVACIYGRKEQNLQYGDYFCWDAKRRTLYAEPGPLFREKYEEVPK